MYKQFKCHFSHPGSCTRITYLHILENQYHNTKSPQIFFGRRCTDNKFQNSKDTASIPSGYIYIHPSKFNFHQSVPLTILVYTDKRWSTHFSHPVCLLLPNICTRRGRKGERQPGLVLPLQARIALTITSYNSDDKDNPIGERKGRVLMEWGGGHTQLPFKPSCCTLGATQNE